MSPEAQRVAIAGSRGWSCAYRHGGHWTVSLNGVDLYSSHTPMSLVEALFLYVPDYINDLNACAEFERALSDDVNYVYGDTLARMVFANEFRLEKLIGDRAEDDDSFFPPNGHGWFALATATAPQRCEAYLRAIGLWKETV